MSGAPVTVRTARPDEYEKIGALTIEAYRRLPVDHLWRGYDEEILDVEGRARHAEVLVAVAGDLVIGSVSFVGDASSRWSEFTRPGEAQFRLLAVDPAARNRGAGRALVRACIERAGNRPMCIYTSRWMEAAHRLYERLGFARRPERDVPASVWDRGGGPLPPEWAGEPFLAYVR